MNERQAKDGTFYQQVGPDEWQPVTREAKDGTVYKKIGPDDWTPLDQRKPEGPHWATSAIRKSIQGVTSGLSDEIAGGTEAAFRAIGIKGAGGPLKDMSLEMPSIDSIKSGYVSARDAERARLKQDEQTNPGVSIVSEIAGGLANPLNKATQGMNLMKQGLVLGAAQGFGSSEANNAADLLLDVEKGALTGQILGKGADKIAKSLAPAANAASSAAANAISPAIPKANQSEIIAAADRLGLKLTPAMLDETGFVQRLEQTLANSPSFLGQRVSKAQKAAYEKLQGAVAEATKDASKLTEFQLGEKAKSGITAKVAERLDPIQATFDEVKQSTKFIPVSDKSKASILANIGKSDEVILTGAEGAAKKYTDMLGRVQNVDQLKTMMTMLNDDISAASGADKSILMMIKKKIGNLEQNTITREAISQAREGGMTKASGEKIGNELVGNLLDARKNYRGLMTDLQETANDARLGKNYGPKNFLDKVENLTSEDMQKRFFNPDNQRQLQNLAAKFPEEFELLRQGKLRDIDLASMGQKGEKSVQKFLNEVDKLSDESKAMIFREGGQLLDDVSTLNNALPKNFNPSGTASQMAWNEALMRNVKDIPTYMLYKGASSNLGKSIGKSMQDGVGREVLELGSDSVKKLSGPVAGAEASLFQSAPSKVRVAEDQGGEDVSRNEMKGFEAFAAQGLDKINKAANDPIIATYLERISRTPAGQDYLIKASNLKDEQQIKAAIDEIKASNFYKQEQEKGAAKEKADKQNAARANIKFPKALRKDGFLVTVTDLDQYDEAIKEGWS